MADKSGSHAEEPFSHKNEPHLSHSLDDLGAINTNDPAVLGEVRKKHTEPSGLKKNANVIIIASAGAAALVLLVVFGLLFFGGESKPRQRAAAVAQPPVTPQQPPAKQPTNQPAQPTPGSGPQASPGQPATATGQPANQPNQPATAPQAPGQELKKEPPKKPPLPDDPAKWKKDDYFRARKENNPKLIEAVAYLGRKCVGSEPAALGLTDLLKPLPPEKPSTTPAPGSAPGPAPATPAPGVPGPGVPGPGPVAATGPSDQTQPRNPADLTKLVETIVEALGCNGSAPAMDTLEQILAGKFVTDDDKAAVEAAVKTLVAHPCDESDALLFRVLTDADALRPSDRAGPWPAKDLQLKAMELVKPAASSGLRTKLAAWVASRSRGFDAKEPMSEYLLTADLRNCGAQLVFYRGSDTPRDMKATLEKQFLDYSSKALARYLWISEESLSGLVGASNVGGMGVPVGRPADQPAAKPAEVSPAQHVVAQLWSDEFRASLEARLGKSSIEQQKQSLLLAATIPCDSTRQILAKVLRKRWYEGPKELEAAGLLDRAIDPGMFVLLKACGPRREKPPAGSPSGAAPRRSDTRAVKKQQAEQDWMDTSSKLVDAWRKRLYAAAQAKEKSEAGSGVQTGGAAAAPKLPDGFELSPGAAVKAAYHLSWPDDAPSEIAKLDLGLLEVYYIRTEESNHIKKLKSFYARQAKIAASDARMIDKSIWIDSLRPAAEKNRRRSLDVLITRTSGVTDNAVDKDNNEEADFLVEILIVEIKDPTKESRRPPFAQPRSGIGKGATSSTSDGKRSPGYGQRPQRYGSSGRIRVKRTPYSGPVEKPKGETLIVSGRNNKAERSLRPPAQARNTGRTNKTVAGARRQTVIVSVLESLRQNLPSTPSHL